MIRLEITKGKKEYTLLIPYAEQYALNQIYKTYNVISVDYLDSGVQVKAVLDHKGRGQYSKYISEE